MQLIIVLAIAVAAMFYSGLIPDTMMLPLPLIGTVIFTFAVIYAIRKA